MTARARYIWLLGLLTCAAGCRGCVESSDGPAPVASGPTMPTGLLTPRPSAAPTSGETPAARLTLTQGTRDGATGPSVELQVARANDSPERSTVEHDLPSSRFLSTDAMTLLHDAFARALPGFHVFVPRLLDPTALGRLKNELASLRAHVAATPDAATARARWGQLSALVSGLPDDAAWQSARAAFLGMIDAITALASTLIERGEGLWVLGS